MADRTPPTSRASRLIRAEAPALFEAFLDPSALAAWMPPGRMRGEVESFEAGIGGGYRMSLIYPPDESGRGKTAADRDTVQVRFQELTPFRRIVEAVTFDTADPQLQGEMTMVITFTTTGDGATEVALAFRDLPPGLRPQDNDDGARMSLEQLARFLE